MSDLRKHKRQDAVKWILVAVAIVLLATAVAAACTDGFQTANPYGWLPEHGTLQKGDVISGFKLVNKQLDAMTLSSIVDSVPDEFVEGDGGGCQAVVGAFAAGGDVDIKHNVSMGILYLEFPEQDFQALYIMPNDEPEDGGVLPAYGYIYLSTEHDGSFIEGVNSKVPAGWSALVRTTNGGTCVPIEGEVTFNYPVRCDMINGYEVIAEILVPVHSDVDLSPCNHVDKDKNGYCDDCRQNICKHEKTEEVVDYIGQDPDCYNDGYKVVDVLCDTCGEAVETYKQVTIPALGHTDESMVDGYCDRCGEKICDHKQTHTQEVDAKEPGCIESGWRDIAEICDTCGEYVQEYREDINPTGHVDEDTDGTCDICGEAVETPSPMRERVRSVAVRRAANVAAAGEVTDGWSTTVTATVLPENAWNKNVTWSIANGSTLNPDPTYYVELATNGNTATVTCIRPFLTGTVTLTATTEDGGLVATCNISYVGHAESADLSFVTAPTSTKTVRDVGTVNLLARGNDYVINYNVHNKFNAVADSVSNQSLSAAQVVFVGHGKAAVGDGAGYTTTIDFNSQVPVSNFFQVSFDGNRITIRVIEDYKCFTYPSNGKSCKFYSELETVYFEMIIKLRAYGEGKAIDLASTPLYISTIESPSAVSLDKPTIVW